nr:copper amine oxidase N-terminal domain-containing protein [Paenibacillus sp. PCH8]
MNGETLEIDAPAMIQNSRTLVPVRFIFEGLGLTVDWNQSAAQMSLISK